jgi:thioredoxin 1
MDFDASHETAFKFKVQSIPTLLFFNSGELKDRLIGAVPRKVLLEHVDTLIA